MTRACGRREKTFNIRFSEEEWARLDSLSTHYGLTAASLVRMLLKKECDKAGHGVAGLGAASLGVARRGGAR